MATNRKVVVTGGAGYIGSLICKALQSHGYLPVTIDNLSQGHTEAVLWGPLEVGDITDRSFLEDVLRRHCPMGVIHCAALTNVGTSVSCPTLYYRNNVVGTLTLIEAMQSCAIQVIIFSSTCAIYGSVTQVPISETAPQAPISPYGWSKLMSERLLLDAYQAYGMRCALLRYFNAAGADLEGEIGETHAPETHLIPLALQAAQGLIPHLKVFGNRHPTPDGTPIRDYVHVLDIASAHIQALEFLLQSKRHIAVNLGSGCGNSVLEVIKAAERICGRSIPMQIEAARPGDAAVLIADNRRAKSLLNWNPKFSSLETILDTSWRWATQPSRPSQLSLY